MKRLILIAMVVLLSASIAPAQNICEGDFDCDGNVDADDITKFLKDFGRNQYNNPCPPCVPPVEMPKTGQTELISNQEQGQTMGSIIGTLIGFILGIVGKIGYDWYKENKQVKMLKLGLKNEIRRIREDIIERKPNEQYQRQGIHVLFRQAKDISDDLIGFYQIKRGDLGILKDRDLIYRINKFYEKYGIWRDVRKEIIVSLQTKDTVEHYPRNPLEENWELMEWLNSNAEALEQDL